MRRIIKALSVLFAAFMVIAIAGCGDEEAKRIENGSFSFTAETFPNIAVTAANNSKAKAVAEAVLGQSGGTEDSYTKKYTADDVYRSLLSGECKIAFVPEMGKELASELEQQGMTFDMQVIDTDALVFVTESQNPAETLTAEQISGLLNGEITNWKGICDYDRTVLAFRAVTGTTSSMLFEKYVGTTTEMPGVKSKLITSDGTFEADMPYDDIPGAIGFTTYGNLSSFGNGSHKVLSVDGKAPTPDNIRSGEYHFTCPVYAVILSTAETSSPERILYNWLMSEQGKTLLDSVSIVKN